MVNFVDVFPEDIPDVSITRRKRISSPILNAFLETAKYVVQLEKSETPQEAKNVYSSLTAYVKNHALPVKVIFSKDLVYLVRLDFDKEGNPIEDWKEQLT